MVEEQVFHIDLVQTGELAHTGVRRAVLVMGLGLNAANREDFNDYQLYKLPPVPGQTEGLIDFFPSDLPVERVKEIKAEFAKWIISYGLRELIEHFAFMLDTIHNYSLRTLQIKGELGNINPVKAQEQFHRSPGFKGKLSTLDARFGIKVPHASSLIGLYLARNVFTHTFGTVTANHCLEGRDMLMLTWNALQTVAIGCETGKEVPVNSLIGKITTEKMNICVRKITREREYKIGERIEFSQQDLSEICAFFGMTLIPETLEAFADFLIKQGVKGADAPAA